MFKLHSLYRTNSGNPEFQSTFAGLFLVNMVAMLGMGILLPLLSPFAKELGASKTIVGVIFGGFAIARGVFSPLFGRLSDRYGRKIFMAIGLVMYAVLALNYTFLQSLHILAVIWFFQGMAATMVAPIAQSYIGDITPEGKEGRVMNLFYLGQFGGIAIGPILGGYLSDHVSFAAPFYVMTAVSLFALVLVYFLIPEQSASSLRQSNDTGTDNSFLDVLRDRDMQGIISYMMGRGFYRWGFNSLFPIYAITVASLSKSQVGLIITSYMISGALLQYPSGQLAVRFPECRSEFVVIGGTLAALSMLPVHFISQTGWLIVLMAAMGIFSAFSRASTVAIRTKKGRIHGMGAVTGVYMAAFSWGQVLGPLGFGAIADVWSIPVSFFVGAGIGVVSAIIAYWYLRNEAKGKRGAQVFSR